MHEVQVYMDELQVYEVQANKFLPEILICSSNINNLTSNLMPNSILNKLNFATYDSNIINNKLQSSVYQNKNKSNKLILSSLSFFSKTSNNEFLCILCFNKSTTQPILQPSLMQMCCDTQQNDCDFFLLSLVFLLVNQEKSTMIFTRSCPYS